MSNQKLNPHNASIIYGRDIEIGDIIEFLGKPHPITRIENYDVPEALRRVYAHGARIAHDDSANWGITLANEEQQFYCERHNWWTATGCPRCIHGY